MLFIYSVVQALLFQGGPALSNIALKQYELFESAFLRALRVSYMVWILVGAGEADLIYHNRKDHSS